mgnify:CR=1 FL=1
MKNKGIFIFLGAWIAFAVAANIPGCNPPGRMPSTSELAKRVCAEVYSDSDDTLGHSECISNSYRRMKRDSK